ncbi:hypothetical protein FPOAC2_01121 [Fusarium poae]|jgi:hypothetical protein|uniref:Uncharacterized protein n=1 Tax=Fusarium poae TaxID=36050 RepID=A0A1B8B2C8_FUSPO|nr:hypothetical protein FPOAC1_001054 [Fusarium poae]KAG8675077.1 hypothetical protein FPOAC1_001054 [Fusarium poae]OBS26877.1 hypothetical protein FPOA_00820 [Fusarium poae]
MDDPTLVPVRSEPSNQQCQKNVIFHEAALVPGNITHMKRALFDELPDAEMRKFRERLKLENDGIRCGFILSPVSKVLVSASSPDTTLHFGTNYQENGVDQYYMLMYLLLATLMIPPEMIRIVEALLRKHDRDPMPLNTAIATVIIFADLQQKHPIVESFVNSKSRGQWTSKFKSVTMTQSVIYFPHLLRSHENGKYTRYTHPLRWAYQQYHRDSTNNHDFALGDQDAQLPQDQLLELATHIKGRIVGSILFPNLCQLRD